MARTRRKYSRSVTYPMKKNILILLGTVIIIGGAYMVSQQKKEPPLDSSAQPSASALSGGTKFFGEPISHALSRITKKPFGIYITPKTSPVQPEKFTGYHTGVDFETSPAEADTDVSVYAICDGPLLEKITASGYGGVAVQRCSLDGPAVTIVYGHIKLASVTATVGQQLAHGQQLAILGKGYSIETDGERKHLHLGIHKGSTINILGYVQKQADLSQWLDWTTYNM